MKVKIFLGCLVLVGLLGCQNGAISNEPVAVQLDQEIETVNYVAEAGETVTSYVRSEMDKGEEKAAFYLILRKDGAEIDRLRFNDYSLFEPATEWSTIGYDMNDLEGAFDLSVNDSGGVVLTIADLDGLKFEREMFVEEGKLVLPQ